VLGIKKLGKIKEKINVSFKEELMMLVEELKKKEELTGVISAISLKEDVSDIIKKLIDIRLDLRNGKKFKSADLIRDRLKDIGVVLEDTNTGTTYKLVYTRGAENEKQG
jgi:cysteinyl-tRNA synthetase